ncbi:M1 family aminopeptidase [Pedobacter sp. N23S346]|uniref:ABC transporter permease/M1 family aminopeptidase n=1 Tax=Pedobacter sp. N23S346 TaxID=3402750 RepID=UPI003AC89A0C
MIALLKFELGAFLKQPGIYIVFFLLFALGFFIGIKLSFSPGSEIYCNSPYAIANMIGLLSLCNIFITTLLAAQILFKEHDSRFSLVLYATPITRFEYLLSRFITVLLLGLLCFSLLIFGYLSGHLADTDRASYRAFNLWYYLQPVLILGFPNLLLCAVLVSSVAWSLRSKLMVYLTGLFIYIIYLVMLTYSGSPMMASGLPQSKEALRLSAQLDPFGLSAFYEQTNLWTVVQKNNEVFGLSGDLLLNRIGYLFLSLMILSVVFLRFQLRIKNSGDQRNKAVEDKAVILNLPYKYLISHPHGWKCNYQALKSLVNMEFKVLVKSIPFVLISLGLVFYLSMEFYGSIDQGIRLPQQYATSTLMINRILFNLPGILILVILFYAHELYWKSKEARFDLIECSTPTPPILLLLSKWISLSIIIILLTTIIIITGIAFQVLFDYVRIDWQIYFTLYWLIDVPLVICIGITLLLQKIINLRWTGLLISSVFILVLATSLGKTLGITNPLLRFAASYSARYSEMNGWDNYLVSFSWRLLFGIGLISLLWMAKAFSLSRLSLKKLFSLAIPLLIMLFSGIYIYRKSPKISADQEMGKLETYERNYRKFSNIAQPVVTSVKTRIDLYPAENTYHVSGVYVLKNKWKLPISQLLLDFHNAIQVEKVVYQVGARSEVLSKKNGMVQLHQPLMPGDSAIFSFSFGSGWNGFIGHEPFNAIVKNGTFLRISNYFPRFGYQPDKEISSAAERRKRSLPKPTPLIKLEAPRGRNDFINLDMTVSVPIGQRVIGVGNLAGQWKSNGRNYFHYQSAGPIPFRFGLSAAAYKLKKMRFKGINIEVYYDERHFENVAHLIKNAARTLDYCQTNFGPYPYKTIRFAEVSSFTDGFAGTAYPATIFMTEQLIFHNNLRTDRGQNVINELAAHELSHQWWGNAQLAPDEREGSKVLTETLAMYTELVLANRYLGIDAVRDKVKIHEQIYLNERGFGEEVPLFRARPEDTHLYYSKGLVVMAKLNELIGEKRINLALRNLLKKHAYPNQPPISTDLLMELHRVIDVSIHSKIDKLFDR